MIDPLVSYLSLGRSASLQCMEQEQWRPVLSVSSQPTQAHRETWQLPRPAWKGSNTQEDAQQMRKGSLGINIPAFLPRKGTTLKCVPTQLLH